MAPEGSLDKFRRGQKKKRNERKIRRGWDVKRVSGGVGGTKVSGKGGGGLL